MNDKQQRTTCHSVRKCEDSFGIQIYIKTVLSRSNRAVPAVQYLQLFRVIRLSQSKQQCAHVWLFLVLFYTGSTCSSALREPCLAHRLPLRARAFAHCGSVHLGGVLTDPYLIRTRRNISPPLAIVSKVTFWTTGRVQMPSDVSMGKP